jgi:phosphatidylglycerophosphatase A
VIFSKVTGARFVASGFGTGLAPTAAGTVGSFVALVLGAGLMLFSPWGLPIAAVLATFGGIWAIEACGASHDDPGWVTIDEFAGQWIGMLALARPSWLGLGAAFAVFRLLDITKPGPVGWADRQKSAVGVMGDDVMAGGLTWGILWAVQTSWPGLLG